ncbi:hypothetical protein L5M43_17000 [Shewanella sp. SW36]|uniref:HNH endonuclease n=1 Tax=unclassified Shewanella TaxID=196818 RepID=UPI0021DA6A8A|nr:MULTISPECIES: HNH endonuclease [unclassified Shewanella]MCU7976934.1 hypothetical protein [Shewanella sp. SW36]MCU7992174.1 hypothetical protein [Shewanella sp. SW1]MCU8054477.1 hypothetical protein [Shewanella sp. SM43]
MARESGFKAPTIKLLKERVAHRCSKPDCRVSTIGPILGELKSGCIGEAAHIFAASPGAARYDPNMTSDERMHFDNGIWLCTNCHTEIDRDPALYPASLLQSWKSNAEAQALQERGEKLPSKTDAIDQLCMAMTRQPQVFIPNAIENVHIASGLALEQIDPRFFVETGYERGVQSYILNAKENIPLSLTIENIDENKNRWHSFLEHGEDFVSSTQEISLKGSDLFNVLVNSREGRFEIKGQKIPASVRLEVIGPTTSERYFFCEVNGSISSGMKTFTFTGEACNGIFSMTLRKSHDLTDVQAQIDFSVNMTKWEQINIIKLPYFERVYDFYTKLSNGKLSLSLEVEGRIALKSKSSINWGQGDIYDTAFLLTYIDKCRRLSAKLNLEIYYPVKYSYSQLDLNNIDEALDIFDGKAVFKYSQFTKRPSICMSISLSKAKQTLKLLNKKNGVLRWESSDVKSVCLFNEKIELPRLMHVLQGYYLSTISKLVMDDDSISYEFEILPKDNFKLSHVFDSDPKLLT